MKDIRYILSYTFSKTAESIKGNALLFVVSCAMLTFFKSISEALFSGGMGYILNYFIQILILSLLAKILNNMVTANKMPKSDFKYYLEKYFINIMNTYFVFYIFKLFYNLFAVYFTNAPISMDIKTRLIIVVLLLYIIEEIVLGSLFEAVYIDGLGGLNAYRRALTFIKNNIIQWTIVSAPYLILKLAETGILTNYYQLPIWIKGIISVMTPILLLFKGKAYMLLSESTKRKRKFMMEYYKK